MDSLLNKIVGHSHIKKSFLNAIEKDKLATTHLFVGPSGIGKRLFAQALTQTFVCRSTKKPCGKCPECQRILLHQSESLLEIQTESLQIKVDQIQSVHRFTAYKNISSARGIIINDAHKLNPQASNKLLKLLEEPPSCTYFFLITSNPNSILPTLRSRSQITHFAPLNFQELKQVMNLPDWIAKSCQGRLDLANALKDPQKSKIRKSIQKLISQLFNDELLKPLEILNEYAKDKEKAEFLIQMWIQFLRDIYVFPSENRYLYHADSISEIKKFSKLGKNQLENLELLAIETEKSLQQTTNRQLALENLWLTSKNILKGASYAMD